MTGHLTSRARRPWLIAIAIAAIAVGSALVASR